MLKLPGTILPTRAELAKADAHADRQARLAEEKALRDHPELRRCERRVVGRMFPEVRFYDTTYQYAIISRRDGRVIWFGEGPDGEIRRIG